MLKAQTQTPAAYLHARVNGRIRQCLLDSGADVSLIPSQLVSDDKITPDERRLLAANNTTIHIYGQSSMPLTVGKQRLSATLLVSPNVDEIILGRDWLQENNVVCLAITRLALTESSFLCEPELKKTPAADDAE